MRCQISFEENSIVATSAGNNRYCYNCASKINLVTGNINQDLQLDKTLKYTINHVQKISKKIQLIQEIELMARKIITESFKRSLLPSKNLEGLACAAIYFAVVLLQKEMLDNITEQLPVNFRVIQKNFGILRYLLINSEIMRRFNGN